MEETRALGGFHPKQQQNARAASLWRNPCWEDSVMTGGSFGTQFVGEGVGRVEPSDIEGTCKKVQMQQMGKWNKKEREEAR